MKIGFADYEKYLEELAKYKKQDVNAIKEKMKNSGTPGTRGTTVGFNVFSVWVTFQLPNVLSLPIKCSLKILDSLIFSNVHYIGFDSH